MLSSTNTWRPDMSTACCPADTLSVARNLPQSLMLPPRWPGRLKQRWRAWRERSQRRAELRALDELSDDTRRDIGLAERGLPMHDRSLWEHGRGLW
jgi:uncharacterized protein YjiS (DUF1127 family)